MPISRRKAYESGRPHPSTRRIQSVMGALTNASGMCVTLARDIGRRPKLDFVADGTTSVL
jgi:hypothetical protein